MQVMETHEQARPASFQAAVRNRYYFGKLLDVVHFDIEQDYFNSKRWLINRMVLGYGVVCGLDVQLCNYDQSIIVTSGFALDKWGREIIVPAASREKELPEPPPAKPSSSPGGCDDEDCYYHLCICYYECASSPEPLSDDCGAESCVNSLVHERYKLEWRKGKAPDPPPEDCAADLLSGDRINRRALALHVTQGCQDLPCDPCIPLANVKLAKPDGSVPADVDITIRPVVYTNDLLYELITAMNSDRQARGRGGK